MLFQEGHSSSRPLVVSEGSCFSTSSLTLVTICLFDWRCPLSFWVALWPGWGQGRAGRS